MDIYKFRKIQSEYAKRDNARLDERLNAGDTDTPYFQRINEEMLADLIERVEVLEGAVKQLVDIITPKE